jgi:hypothetical protein
LLAAEEPGGLVEAVKKGRIALEKYLGRPLMRS